MRVTNSLLYNNINSNLQKQMNQIYQLNDNLSSGVRLHTPSDDPFAVSVALDLDTSISENTQYQSNIKNGHSWLGYTSESLGHAQDMAQTLYTKAVSTDNDSMDPQARENLSLQVNDLLEELVNQANDKFGDRYILNGDATNAKPFLDIRNSDNQITGVAQFVEFAGGNPNSPTYVYFDDAGTPTYYDKDKNITAPPSTIPVAGEETISGELNRKVGVNDYIDISTNGANAYQPDGPNTDKDVFQAAIELRDGLRNNDKILIGNSIDKLKSGMDQITNAQARTGTIYNRLEIESEMMDTKEINLTEVLSSVEDTDVSKAMMEYTRLQATYQMSLQVGATIMQTSLVSFI